MALGASVVVLSSAGAAPGADTRTVAIVPLRDGIHPEEGARALRDEIAKAVASVSGVKVVDGERGGDSSHATQLAEAKARAEKARAHVRRADFEKSIPEFEAAAAAYVAALPAQNDGALFDLLLEHGAALLDLNRAPQAVEVFRKARLLGGPDALDPKLHSPRRVAAWKDAVASLKGKLGAALLVTTSPGGATVAIDGRRAGISPLLVQNVADGSHVIRAELAGHQPRVLRVTATAGKSARADLELAKTMPVGFERGVDAAASIEEVFRNAVDVGAALDVDVLVLAGWVRQPGMESDRLQAMVIDVRREVLVDGGFHTASPAAAKSIAERVASHVKTSPPAAPPAVRIEVAP